MGNCCCCCLKSSAPSSYSYGASGNQNAQTATVSPPVPQLPIRNQIHQPNFNQNVSQQANINQNHNPRTLAQNRQNVPFRHSAAPSNAITRPQSTVIITNSDVLRKRQLILSKPHFNAVPLLCSILNSTPEDLTARMNVMQFISSDAWEYPVILQYINNSQAHDEFGIEVESIVKICQRHVTEFRNRPEFSHTWNRMMLWHGTVFDNVRSILERGLEIPRAQTRNCLFGNGIYFADRVSKSATYCNSTSTGIVFLCDVHLGKSYPSVNVLHGLTSPPSPFDSVQGIGKYVPGKKRRKFHGSSMPIGKTVSNTDHSNFAFDYTINYNEFVVYDPDAVNIRYLVYFKFTDRPFVNRPKENTTAT